MVLILTPGVFLRAPKGVAVDIRNVELKSKISKDNKVHVFPIELHVGGNIGNVGIK